MKQSGFTLLEIMLVIVLMGSVATLVIGTFPSADERIRDRFSQKLNDALTYASEMAMYNEQVYGLLVHENKWALKVLNKHQSGKESVLWPDYEWRQVKQGRYSFNDALPDSYRLKLFISGKKTEFNSEHIDEPQIVFLPGGEITDYRLEILNKDTQKISIINSGRDTR
jgi:general secretion pathway protein H